MPTLSHSQLELFTGCPRKWKLTKIDRVKQAPSEALIFGDAIHQALELDGKQGVVGGARLSTYELGEAFAFALGERLMKDDPAGKTITEEVCDTMLDKAHAIFSAYVYSIQPVYRPISCEESFACAIPGKAGWTFTGRIDARLVEGTDFRIVLDWKTGKAWQPGEEHSREQADAYLWALGDQDAVRFVVFPVEEIGGSYGVRHVQIRTTTRSESQLAAYGEHVANVAGQIEDAKASGVFPTRPGYLCNWCELRHACKDGRDWLESPKALAWLAKRGEQARPLALPIMEEKVA